MVGLVVVGDGGGGGGGGADDETGAELLGGTGEEMKGIPDCGGGSVVGGEVVVGMGTGTLVSGEVVIGAGARVVSWSLSKVDDPSILGPGVVVPCAVAQFALVAFASPLPKKLPYNLKLGTFLPVVVRGIGITSCVTVA